MALAVFALAGVALVQMQTQSVRTFTRIEARALARLVAENALVDMMARRDTPTLGVRQGDATLGGKTWRWRLNVASTSDVNTFRLEASAFSPQDEAATASIVAFKSIGAQ